MQMQLQHVSHAWLFEERLLRRCSSPSRGGDSQQLGVWSEHPQTSPGLLWWVLAPAPQTGWLLCASAAGFSLCGMPWQSQPQNFSCFDILLFFKYYKNHSGIAVRCHCRAGFDPERYVEQFIICISKYLSIPIRSWIYNWTLTVKKNLLLTNYFVTHQWQKEKKFI